MSQFDPQEHIAHLNMIQSIITRMSGNSASAKNLCITIVAALLALYANKPVIGYLYIAYMPIILFFFLDAKYLRLERAYRALYDSVRLGSRDKVTDFYLSPSFQAAESTVNVAFTWSVSWFYLSIGTVITGLLLS